MGNEERTRRRQERCRQMLREGLAPSVIARRLGMKVGAVIALRILPATYQQGKKKAPLIR